MNLVTAEVPGIEITGSGTAFPSDADPTLSPLSNAEAWEILLGDGWLGVLQTRGWSEDYPEESLGVRCREWWGRPRRAPRNVESGAEALARVAAERALTSAGIEATEVELVVASTSTPGRITSSLAHHVARFLGSEAAAIDVRVGGAGALAGWTTAALHLVHGARTALVVAAEVPSVYCDPEEPNMAMLYGDGGAAIVLRSGARADAGLLGAVSGGSTYSGRAFTVPGALPPREKDVYCFQKPDSAYQGALRRTWDETAECLRELAGSPPEHLLPYGVTREQIERVAGIVGTSAGIALEVLAEHGCTGCASPLIAVHELRASGSLKRGDRLGLCAVAGGIAWQAMLWRV